MDVKSSSGLERSSHLLHGGQIFNDALTSAISDGGHALLTVHTSEPVSPALLRLIQSSVRKTDATAILSEKKIGVLVRNIRKPQHLLSIAERLQSTVAHQSIIAGAFRVSRLLVWKDYESAERVLMAMEGQDATDS